MDVLISKDPRMSVINGAVVFAREGKLLAFRVQDVICVAAVHIGRNKTAMPIQFRDKFQHDPNQVLCVPFLGSNGVHNLYNSTCVLFDQAMNLNSVGIEIEAEEKYRQLCDLSIQKKWRFFKDFYLQLEEQVTHTYTYLYVRVHVYKSNFSIVLFYGMFSPSSMIFRYKRS
ncbi:hypothetical protein CHS0354_032396 [Potamilus streckersoni]|uniref:Uncharacterized protein n=1 Tax=Potamilus streckersoni TaxID=2493646 RepID=A0AAE0THG4_9BIVA|nr:hypothetical protein CHS0354_032396 [Potamilus streckersoni]